jgi:hypothetical protein
VTIVPSVVAAEAIERYGFVSLGRTEECQIELYLITAERRIEHPVMTVLAREAGRALLGRGAKSKIPRKPPGAVKRRTG